MWRKCVSAEQTRREADFLERVLGKGKRLLDAPCGNGRHSLELAHRGHQVTGLDLSEEFIDEARRSAASEGLKVEFVRGDMRRLNWQSEFDGACCLGNSFGYFEYPDMLKFVKGLAGSLKPGARFVIETGCAAESLLPNLEERSWYQVQDIFFGIENTYLADISCLETNCTFIQNGKTEVRKFWHWVYTVGEIRRLLAEAGLVPQEFYGSHDGEKFKAGSRFLLLVGEKPGS